MTETPVAEPTAADKAARTAGPGKGSKPVTADPEAPYGWMTDPKTGETRPKKRPGKQSKTAPAPRSRPTNKTRAASPPPTTKDYSKPVSELVESVWLILAGVPTIKSKVFGVDLADPTTRLRAQAAIVKANGSPLVQGISMMAQHSAPVRSAVDKLSDETGPAWIIPTMFALMPFVGQTVSMWRAPLAGDVQKMADQSEAEWDAMIKGVTAQAQAQAEADLRAAQEEATRANGDGSS